MKLVGLFAGIGGLEEGFRQAGHHAVELCEIDAAATAVLRARFPGVTVQPDVRELTTLPHADLLTAGFPCQDLSQAGLKEGIAGQRSGLVQHVFRLLRRRATRPSWVLLENVSYMVRLDRGAAVSYITDSLSSLGYRWAYRVLDARSFGVPQRRQRIIILGSLDHDPAQALLAHTHEPPADLDDIKPVVRSNWYGFYWTEGKRGIGWATEAVPTIKGGSTLGIASPPAVWDPATDFVGLPSIEDAERLQGFPSGWTEPAAGAVPYRKGSRWTLVGNAVCVPMAKWIAERLICLDGNEVQLERLAQHSRWPIAATGYRDKVWVAPVTMWPRPPSDMRLRNFLGPDLSPLSARAGEGFLSRASDSVIRFPDGFLESVRRHTIRVSRAATVA